MSDRSPVNLDTDGAGNVTLPALVEAAADNVPVRADPSSELSPTKGRIAKDNDGNVYIADGIRWQSLNDTVGLDLAQLPNTQIVRSAADLPDASGGVRTLDNKTYLFVDFVIDDATLELGNPSPLIGRHGGSSGYIHTGGSDAFRTTGQPFFARDLFFHAPGGTLFDLSADDQTDMLVESCSASDAVGLGSMTSLGTISGYRVQTFKTSNFEDFEGGLTYTGDTGKTVIDGSVYRNPQADGVTIHNFDSGYNAEITKFTGSTYFRNVRSDTVMVDVAAGSLPSQFFKYFDVDHDSSVVKSNILGGGINQSKKGVIVRSAFPIADARVSGQITLTNGPQTQVGSGAGATAISDGTFDLTAAERVLNGDGGGIEYDSRRDADIELRTEMTIQGAQTTVEIHLAKNGTPIDDSQRRQSISGAQKPSTISAETLVADATDGDRFTATLENIGGSTDLDVVAYSLRISEA